MVFQKGGCNLATLSECAEERCAGMEEIQRRFYRQDGLDAGGDNGETRAFIMAYASDYFFELFFLKSYNSRRSQSQDFHENDQGM